MKTVGYGDNMFKNVTYFLSINDCYFAVKIQKNNKE